MGTQKRKQKQQWRFVISLHEFHNSKGHPSCNVTVVQLHKWKLHSSLTTLMSFAYVIMKLDTSEGLETEESRPTNMLFEECSVHTLKFKYKLGYSSNPLCSHLLMCAESELICMIHIHQEHVAWLQYQLILILYYLQSRFFDLEIIFP